MYLYGFYDILFNVYHYSNTTTVEASVGFSPSSMYNPRLLPNRGFSFRREVSCVDKVDGGNFESVGRRDSDTQIGIIHLLVPAYANFEIFGPEANLSPVFDGNWDRVSGTRP